MGDFNVIRIHHLGFVVKDLAKSIKKWETLFGMRAQFGENPAIDVKFATLRLANIDIILNESTKPGSRWDKFIEEHGEGLEHIAFVVDDIKGATEKVIEMGLSLQYDKLQDIHELLANFVPGMDATIVELMG